MMKNPNLEHSSIEQLCCQKTNIMDDLQKIKYSNKSSVCHSKLSEICYPGIKEGTKSEYSYKVVMAYLAKCVNGRTQFLKSDGTRDCTRCAAPKNDKNTSIVNHGNCHLLPNTIQTKRKSATECSACQFDQDICATDHCEYSKKCPQQFNPNHKKKLKDG
jgi:hypothetical protein